MEFTKEAFKELCKHKGTNMSQATRKCNSISGTKFTPADIHRYFAERHFSLKAVIGLIEGAGGALMLSAPDGIFKTEVRLGHIWELMKSIMYAEDITFKGWVHMCTPMFDKEWEINSATRAVKDETVRFYRFNALMEVLGYQLSIKE